MPVYAHDPDSYDGGYVEHHIDECLCQGCANSEIQYMERAKLNYLWYSKMLETREAMALQLNEIAGIVENFTNLQSNVNKFSFVKEEQLKRRFKERKIYVRKISINENSKGRFEVRLSAKKKKKSKADINNMEKILSQYIGRSMRAVCLDYDDIPVEYGQFVFFEDVNFMAMHGAARRTKEKEEMSGDNFTFMEMESGQTFMSICDGMGSGERAKNYSETIIELLEQLLENGLHEETAVKLINSVLLTGDKWDAPSTVDMGLIDMYSGACRFLKLGAACTYIKRGNWVECIRSTSLPMGVLNEVDVETITKKLYSGDFVVMISDGIVESLQCADKEKAMARLIMDIETNNPREMALDILNQSLEMTEGIPKDDMTVLVTGIWEKVS